MREIKNILICGAGMMGINMAFAMSKNPGMKVVLYNRSKKDIETMIRNNTAEMVEEGVLGSEELEERLSRIFFTTDLNSPLISMADFVMEAVFEDISVKHELFLNLESRCRKDCIFSSNSSVIKPSRIGEVLAEKERFLGIHFWNPAHILPLVEVIPTKDTSQDTIQQSMNVLISAGKEPILCQKEVPGFIGNRLMHALWREAISLVEHGVADAKTIDTAVRNSFGQRLAVLGPMENMDMVGLDLTYNIHDDFLKDLEDTHVPSPLLTRLKEEGKLGFKTGEGFQRWSEEEIAESKTRLNRHLLRMMEWKKADSE